MARSPAARRAKGRGDRDAPSVRTGQDLFREASAALEQTHRLREQAAALARAQRELEEANERFADLYDFVPIPYLIVSDLGIIKHVNDAALQMLGGAREWVEGRPLIGYVDTLDMRRVLDHVLSSSRGFSQSLEVRLRARGGVRVAQMMTQRRRQRGQSAVTFHIALVDLTEMRRLDDERRAAELERRKSQEGERIARAASEAKDQFLTMLSHELRTPLTPILAAADTLVAEGSLPPEVMARLEIIRRNVKAEARLIDDLLDVARITRNKLEISRQPFDLRALLTEVLDGWRAPIAQLRVKLDVAFDADGRWVDGDMDRMGQVFRNLLSNAVKFSEAGGRISVRTDERNGRIRVTLTDAGTGITPAQMEKLFTSFAGGKETSPRRGLGLGLVISHAIVEAHEGTLQVWSAGPGKGTTVRVELPTIPRPADAGSPRPGPEPCDASIPNAKVLLVEDDPDTAEMLALLLSSAGFQVQTAHSVYQARTLAECCEVLVSDIALPDGSGLDLMGGLRSRSMRGVALSGHGSRRDVENSLDAGFEEHLTKPVDLEQLVAAVRRLATPR